MQEAEPPGAGYTLCSSSNYLLELSSEQNPLRDKSSSCSYSSYGLIAHLPLGVIFILTLFSYTPVTPLLTFSPGIILLECPQLYMDGFPNTPTEETNILFMFPILQCITSLHFYKYCMRIRSQCDRLMVKELEYRT